MTEERINPLPKYFSAIRDFPTPSSTTDIKSWFGLVNQLAPYAQLRDILAPFRPFLSEKKQPFHLTMHSIVLKMLSSQQFVEV